MDNTKFDNYLQLKNTFNYSSKNISFNSILTPELIQIAYSEGEVMRIGIIGMLKVFLRQVSFCRLEKAFNEGDIISTNSNDRKDNLELVTRCFENVDAHKHVRLTSLKRRYGINHSVLDVFDIMIFFFAKDKSKYSFKVKLYLAVSTVYYMNALRSLDQVFLKTDLKKKKYIAFNSSYDLESLITQYFNNNSIDTFHLSHGLSYINYKIFRPFDCVNGENLCAKNILVWGNSSKEDLKKIYKASVANKNVIVAGNPKYPFKKISLKKSFQKGIVFLGRNIYDKGNVDLLRLIGEYSKRCGIKFNVKIHPFTDINKIKIITDQYGINILRGDRTVSEILKEDGHDFAICFNTTVYYEAMYFNMHCFRYGVGENECFLGLDDKFQSEMELLNLINKFKSSNSELMNKTVENLLIKTLGMGINKYREILENE